MKTLIYQSYRDNNIPEWISYSLKQTKDWAELNNYDYKIIDDSFFRYAPDWFRKKVKNQMQLVTDMARIIAAKEFLNDYERVVWIDADLFIFDKDKFSIDMIEDEFGFCAEIWVGKWLFNKYKNIHRKKVNNSVSIFKRNNNFLDFYIYSALRIIELKHSKIHSHDIGTRFLTSMNKLISFPLLKNTGLLNPLLIESILSKKETNLNYFMQQTGNKIYAANLCASLTNKTINNLMINDSQMMDTISILENSKGEILNQYIK